MPREAVIYTLMDSIAATRFAKLDRKIVSTALRFNHREWKRLSAPTHINVCPPLDRYHLCNWTHRVSVTISCDTFIFLFGPIKGSKACSTIECFIIDE